MVYVRSDQIKEDCSIKLLSGDVKYLSTGAYVKFVSKQYWPRHVEQNFMGIDSDVVIVYSQYGMGFIQKRFLLRGTYE